MLTKKISIFNKISLLGLGIVILSLGILTTLEIPRKPLKERAIFLFWLGTGTTIVGCGIDDYFRKKDRKSITSTTQEDPEFWVKLERELWESSNDQN